MYQYRDISGNVIELPLGKAVCVGRNYADHIQELNNAVPDEPLLFIKPNTALCDMAQPLNIPTDSLCHNELEVALLIAKPIAKPLSGTEQTDKELMEAIWGVGLALDLTLREKQSELKEKGYPWERAKAFDNSCPLSAFVPMSEVSDIQNIEFTLSVDGAMRQEGNTQLMLNDCLSLIREITTTFTLLPGDLVLTGTPKGVGALNSGNQLHAQMMQANSKPLIACATKVS